MYNTLNKQKKLGETGVYNTLNMQNKKQGNRLCTIH